MKFKVAYVYFVRLRDGTVKIGISSKLQGRVQSLGGELLAAIPVLDVEHTLHAHFRRDHVIGEIFDASADLIHFIADLRAQVPELFKIADRYGKDQLTDVPHSYVWPVRPTGCCTCPPMTLFERIVLELHQARTPLKHIAIHTGKPLGAVKAALPRAERKHSLQVAGVHAACCKLSLSK